MQSRQAAMEVAYLDRNVSRGVGGAVATLPFVHKVQLHCSKHLQLSKHYPPPK